MNEKLSVSATYMATYIAERRTSGAQTQVQIARSTIAWGGTGPAAYREPSVRCVSRGPSPEIPEEGRPHLAVQCLVQVCSPLRTAVGMSEKCQKKSLQTLHWGANLTRCGAAETPRGIHLGKVGLGDSCGYRSLKPGVAVSDPFSSLADLSHCLPQERAVDCSSSWMIITIERKGTSRTSRING